MAAAAPPPRRRPPLLLLPLVLALLLPPAALANTNAALLDANKLHDDESVVTLQAEAVAGGVAKLACDMTPPIIGDKASLVIWFKEGTLKPIYSYDARGSGGQAKHWADDTFGGRAFFRVTDNPAHLTVESARDGDGGMYRCRVDFGRSPTRNAQVNLTVILPPEQLLIMDNRGEHIRHFMLGPYNEGDSVDITCEASGGRPLPRVTWWYENIMLDDSYERRSERRVQNVLHLENLQRKELNRVYTCKASNNQLAAPITSFVRLDMNLRPLSVTLLGDNRPFSAEKTYEVSCEVLGARPVPQITWWKGNTQLQNAKEVTSQDQNSTISTLLFTPVVEDSGLVLSCRAENPRLPNSALVDSWTLDIYHVPVVTLQLGRPLNASALTEGVDVFFECHIKANPRIHRVGWRHDRTPLIQNASAGTIISNQSLVLQSVSRARAGMYTCVAVNQEGDGESNPVQLDVKYRPLCRAGQQHTWGVGRGETIEIPCDVDSNPDDVQFTWRLNTTSDSVEIPASKHRADRARSYLSHTPQSERDYGTLLCWGTNALGTQKQPCTFHVIPAGKPNSPINCSLANQTTDSLTVTCSEGFDGGVPKQEFLLELYDEQTHALVSNVTDRLPVFTVGGLESGVDFRADLYAYNTKGRSEPVRMHAYTLKGAERRLAATQAALQITPLVGLLVGVVASLVLAAVLIVVVLRMRGRGEGHDEKSEDRRDKAATISASAGGKGDGKGEPEQGQGQGPTDENNPDLIPDKSADEFVDPEEKAFEYLNDRRLYSTLNPRLGLYSPSSIDHIGPNMPNGPKMDGEVTYAELSLQRPMGDPCIQRSMAPSPQPLSLGPMGGLGGPLSGPLSPMYGPGPGGPGGPGRGLLHTGPYGGGPGSAMTLPHPGQRGGLVSCLRRPPGGPPLGPAHEPTMYAQIAVCRGSLAHGPGLGQGLGLGPGRGRGDSLVEDVAGEAVEAPPMEHRDTSISSLQPLLDTRCNTIGGHGKGVGLMGKPPAAVTATRF